MFQMASTIFLPAGERDGRLGLWPVQLWSVPLVSLVFPGQTQAWQCARSQPCQLPGQCPPPPEDVLWLCFSALMLRKAPLVDRRDLPLQPQPHMKSHSEVPGRSTPGCEVGGRLQRQPSIGLSSKTTARLAGEGKGTEWEILAHLAGVCPHLLVLGPLLYAWGWGQVTRCGEAALAICGAAVA